MNRHLVYALENYHEARVHRAKERGKDISTLLDRYVLVSEGADGMERYYHSNNVWTPYPSNANMLYIEGDLFDVMQALEGVNYHIVRLSSKGKIEDATDEIVDKFVYDHLGNDRPPELKREKPAPEEGPPDFYAHLKERNRARRAQYRGKSNFLDEYYIVTRTPGGKELFNFGFTDEGEPYWTTNYDHVSRGAHPFLELNALYTAMRDIHAQGESFDVLRMDKDGKVEDVTIQLKAECAIHILESIKEEEDMPEETGSKRTTVGRDSAVGVPRDERGYAPGSSKAMIERGEMKLFAVDYKFESKARYGKSVSHEGTMTFLHRGEEIPSTDRMRFELSLRHEYPRTITDGMTFGEPRELSFHQVKMSDLSLDQFIEIQAALMKGEL